jgi:hypothetical protein
MAHVLSFVLVAEISSAEEQANVEAMDEGVRLIVVNCPVLVLETQVASFEVIVANLY